MEFETLKVEVYYPRKNYSGYDFSFTGKIDKKNYDSEGKSWSQNIF